MSVLRKLEQLWPPYRQSSVISRGPAVEEDEFQGRGGIRTATHAYAMEEYPWLDQCPTEVLMMIFCLLDASDLSSAGLVCRRWRSVVNDEIFWRRMFAANETGWRCLHTTPETSSLLSSAAFSESSAESVNIGALPAVGVSWRRFYHAQTFWNRQLSRKPQEALDRLLTEEANVPFIPKDRPRRPSHALSRLTGQWHFRMPVALRSPLQKDVPRLPIFGQGLEHSGKSILYRIMWGPDSPFKITNLFPGMEGIGAGVGFKINKREFNLAAFYQHDINRSTPHWIRFFQLASGLIYVFDMDLNNEKELVEARRELHNLYRETNGVPLLVLSFAATHAIGKSRASSSPLQIAKALKLNNICNHWCVWEVETENLLDIRSALDWISEQIAQ